MFRIVVRVIGGMNYGKQWVGRYNVQKSQLLSATLNPGIAYRVNDWLSLGAGFSVNYALLSQTTAVNNLAERLPDGRHAGWGVLKQPRDFVALNVIWKF